MHFFRNMVTVVVASMVGAILIVGQPASSAQALSGSEFNPGLIIDDQRFYDRTAMSEAEIQQFLLAKGSGLAGMTFSVGSRPRLVSDSTGNLRCDAFQGGTLSASTIIYRAQVSCGISAKVLLVTLQKEQGLITNRAPGQNALDRAMGFACPDTAPCAPTTLGFGNQVYSGALQLNTYKAARFAKQPGWHYIQWHPNASCGGTQVHVQNYATAALYNYTPYQPNPAALANLGGTGDSCSSYGNRNFWTFYQNWFGPTTGLTPYPIVSPIISGASTIGTTYKALPGTWSGNPRFSFEWLLCNARPQTPFDGVPNGCAVVPNVTTDTYQSNPSDVGKFVASLVTGSNAYGTLTSGAVTSAAVGSPHNVAPPVVTGTATVGSTWTVNTGTWTGSPEPTIAIFWLRCDQPIASVYTTVPSGCVAISGADDRSYESTADDTGHYLTAQVAGNSPLGFSLAGAINSTVMGFPVNTSPPVVSGAAAVGSTWTLNPGTWTGTPTPALLTSWLRCDQPIVSAYTTVPAGCAPIAGAQANSYVSTMADVGKYLTAQVAGNSPRGFTLSGAVNSTSIQTALPANTVAPSVSGAASVGATWTVNVGTWSGAPAPTMVIFWLRCDQPITSVYTSVPAGCEAISGANGTSYVSAPSDAGKYLTAQVAGNSPVGFALAGAINTMAMEAP